MENQVSPYLAKIFLSSLHLLDALKERDALKALEFYQEINLYSSHALYVGAPHQELLIMSHKKYILGELLSDDTTKSSI